jgi:hypothetical protein
MARLQLTVAAVRDQPREKSLLEIPGNLIHRHLGTPQNNHPDRSLDPMPFPSRIAERTSFPLSALSAVNPLRCNRPRRPGTP